MSDLRLVVFDVDGTLVDSQADILASVRHAFDLAARPAPDRETILGIVGLSLDEAMAELAPDLTPAGRREMIEGYKASYAGRRAAQGTEISSPLYPGTREMLEHLHGVPEILLAVATGKSRRGLEKLLDGHDLRRFFVAAECADDHPSKPHPAMLEACLTRSGVGSAADAVMVGDTQFDMEMARAAGVPGVAVSWGYHGPERLGAAAAVIHDIATLPEVLDRIWGGAR